MTRDRGTGLAVESYVGCWGAQGNRCRSSTDPEEVHAYVLRATRPAATALRLRRGLNRASTSHSLMVGGAGGYRDRSYWARQSHTRRTARARDHRAAHRHQLAKHTVHCSRDRLRLARGRYLTPAAPDRLHQCLPRHRHPVAAASRLDIRHSCRTSLRLAAVEHLHRCSRASQASTKPGQVRFSQTSRPHSRKLTCFEADLKS